MNTQATMEARLWDYIDGLSDAEEKGFIENLIATQDEWRAKYGELIDVHQLLSGSVELEEPSMRFSQNVMEEIARYQITPAAKTYINKKIIYGIGAFFLTMIVGLLVFGIATASWTDSGPGNENFQKFDLEKFDWSKVFNNTYANIFMMISLILGLMLLDMYLGKRRKLS